MKKAILATKVGMTQIWDEKWCVDSSNCTAGRSLRGYPGKRPLRTTVTRQFRWDFREEREAGEQAS